MFKGLKDALPVYCSEKVYAGVGEIVRNMKDWDDNTFYPAPPSDAEKRTYSQPYMTELCVERQSNVTGQHPTTGEDIVVVTNVPVVGEKWVVFGENEQKIV